jgi:hypothetical protein
MNDRNQTDAGRTSDPHKALATADLAATPEAARRAGNGAAENRAATSAPPADGSVKDAQREEKSVALLPGEESTRFRKDWDRIQTSFVDAPRDAVQEADHLVAATMKRLAETFATERSNLERQWDRGEKVSTEDLRIALQRYRSFFQRLLTI